MGGGGGRRGGGGRGGEGEGRGGEMRVRALVVSLALDEVLGAGSTTDLLHQLSVLVQQLLELTLPRFRFFLHDTQTHTTHTD